MSEIIDNRAHRIRTLKEVIRHLHAGGAPAEVKPRLAALVKECDASEIAAMEQELIAEGVSVSEIMSMCDLHAAVVRDILVDRAPVVVPPGHPVDTFRRENVALGEQAAKLRAALAAGDIDVVRRLYGELMDVEKHYRRKEHLLFACLERHGITGPSTAMWGKDDEVRGLLKELGSALGTASVTTAEAALEALEGMVFKEERILLPMALQNLTDTEWGEIWAQSPQFGYCLVEPRTGYEPPAATDDVPAAARDEAARSGVAFAPGGLLTIAGTSPQEKPRTAEPSGKGALVFPTGSLTLEHLKAIFATLPVDLTLVGADDRVRFFSEGKSRVFERPKTVIGRLVQHCHPPASVDVVDRILGDFRSGRQSVAEFWIEMHGRFVHIRYFALRDDKEAYLGCLEVTQDLTRERKLEGERRLLAYDVHGGAESVGPRAEASAAGSGIQIVCAVFRAEREGVVRSERPSQLVPGVGASGRDPLAAVDLHPARMHPQPRREEPSCEHPRPRPRLRRESQHHRRRRSSVPSLRHPLHEVAPRLPQEQPLHQRVEPPPERDRLPPVVGQRVPNQAVQTRRSGTSPRRGVAHPGRAAIPWDPVWGSCTPRDGSGRADPTAPPLSGSPRGRPSRGESDRNHRIPPSERA